MASRLLTDLPFLGIYDTVRHTSAPGTSDLFIIP